MLAGGAVLRAAAVVLGACGVAVLRPRYERVLRQSDSDACRRADEESQQAEHRYEAGERAPHGVSLDDFEEKQSSSNTSVARTRCRELCRPARRHDCPICRGDSRSDESLFAGSQLTWQ